MRKSACSSVGFGPACAGDYAANVIAVDGYGLRVELADDGDRCQDDAEGPPHERLPEGRGSGRADDCAVVTIISQVENFDHAAGQPFAGDNVRVCR